MKKFTIQLTNGGRRRPISQTQFSFHESWVNNKQGRHTNLTEAPNEPLRTRTRVRIDLIHARGAIFAFV